MGLDRATYLETMRGQWSRYQYRQLRRIWVRSDAHPFRKGRDDAARIQVQHEVFKAMRVKGRSGRRSFRAPLALELCFDSEKPNPPSIHQLAKNYLDLLGHPVFVPNSSRKTVLYRDDKLIRLLFVRLNLEYGSRGTWIKAQSLADFKADIELAERIHHNNFSDANRRRRDAHDPPDDPFRSDLESPDLSELYDLQHREAYWRKALGSSTYEIMVAFERERAQEALLKNADTFLAQLLLNSRQLFATDDGARAPSMRQLVSMSVDLNRKMLLLPSVTRRLERPPRQHGDTEAFKLGVRNALLELRTKTPLLFPLQKQISITILLVPPDPAVGTEQPIDLDNLARHIVPAVHEILQPPSTIDRTLRPPEPKAPTHLRDWYQRQTDRTKRVPEHHITGYQVVLLPRARGDSAEGTVQFAFGLGTSQLNLWDRLERYIEAWGDTFDHF